MKVIGIMKHERKPSPQTLAYIMGRLRVSHSCKVGASTISRLS